MRTTIALPDAATQGLQVRRELLASSTNQRAQGSMRQVMGLLQGFNQEQATLRLWGRNLLEDDYRWITLQLMEVAQRHAGGRIVSCLEGGYNLDALARSVEAHVRVLAGVA